jgi:hypothetical protein
VSFESAGHGARKVGTYVESENVRTPASFHYLLCEQRDMAMRRATPEDIEPYIVSRVGSGGGGQWTFRLPCKFCEDMGVISAKKHSIGNPRYKRKAAENFAAQGWWFDERPVCVTCYERKRQHKRAAQLNT